MTSFVLVLIALSIAAASPVTGDSQCSFNLTANGNLYLTWFSGLWYADSSTAPNAGQVGCDRVNVHFRGNWPGRYGKLNMRGRVDLGSNVTLFNASIGTVNGNNNSLLNGSYSVAVNNARVHKGLVASMVVATDYLDYAMIYSCLSSANAEVDEQVLAFYSREQYGMTNAQRKRLMHIAVAAGWSADAIRRVDQHSCPSATSS